MNVNVNVQIKVNEGGVRQMILGVHEAYHHRACLTKWRPFEGCLLPYLLSLFLTKGKAIH